MKKIILLSSFVAAIICLFSQVFAAELAELRIGSPAPLFELKNDAGKAFTLKSHKGKWTVLYFYPKSETPGCTKQACAFRDQIKKIQSLNAEVIGVSVNTVEDQAKFKTQHQLNFELLADVDAKVAELYGTKMESAKISRRWTFVLDPQLIIREVNKEVDPIKDAERVSEILKQLQVKAPVE